jgi:hypothetical protein
MISIPRTLLERVLDHLEKLTDEGPDYEGWRSKELEADIAAISAVLNNKEKHHEKNGLQKTP